VNERGSPKLFILFNLDFTYYGHALATRWKQDLSLPDSSFRGLVVGRLYWEFLHRQGDIRYEGLALEQDMLWRARTEPPDMEFLAWAERELGEVDTLWRLNDADRSIVGFTRDQVLSTMTIYLKYFFDEFTTHRPDAVIGFTISSLSALACYYVARHLGIPYFELQSTRIRSRSVIAERMTQSELPRIDAAYRRILAGQEQDPAVLRAGVDFVREFRERPTMPDGQARAVKISSKTTSLHPRRLIGLARITWWYYFGPYKRDVDVPHPARQARDALRMGLRLRRVMRGDLFEPPRPGERYAFYALHQQPEMTTMILAPFWQEQLTLIENIARSLPLDTWLYVKEHIPMLGVRPIEYYERLRRVPNIRLIDPFTSSLQLIRDASVVTVIAGTVGWEALLLGVPVITFGQVFYNTIPIVQKCRAIEDLPRLIREAVVGSLQDPRFVEAYVAAILANSFEFDLDRLYDPTRSYESIRDSKEAATMAREYRHALAIAGVFPPS
jgi:hypothetical protein